MSAAPARAQPFSTKVVVALLAVGRGHAQDGAHRRSALLQPHEARHAPIPPPRLTVRAGFAILAGLLFVSLAAAAQPAPELRGLPCGRIWQNEIVIDIADEKMRGLSLTVYNLEGEVRDSAFIEPRTGCDFMIGTGEEEQIGYDLWLQDHEVYVFKFSTHEQTYWYTDYEDNHYDYGFYSPNRGSGNQDTFFLYEGERMRVAINPMFAASPPRYLDE